jgi:hypothetical protein
MIDVHLASHPLATTPLCAITPVDVEAILDAARKRTGRAGQPLSAKTLRNLFNLMRSGFDHAARTGRIASSPMRGLTPPQPRRNPEAMKSWTRTRPEHSSRSSSLRRIPTMRRSQRSPGSDCSPACAGASSSASAGSTSTGRLRSRVHRSLRARDAPRCGLTAVQAPRQGLRSPADHLSRAAPHARIDRHR